MDIRDADTTELRQLKQMIDQELQRRDTLATAEAKATELNSAYLAAAGIEPGQEWKQPTSAVDAYPQDWEVEYEGKTYVSLTPANVWAPNVSGWREVVEVGGAPEWVQPTGQHDAYQSGDQVTFEGAVYESVIDANTWSPEAYPAGWKAI